MRSYGRMDELKTATKELLQFLSEIAYDEEAVRVSIVPFNTQVKIGTSYAEADWLLLNGAVEQAANADCSRKV